MLYAKIVSIFISMVFLAFDDVAKCLDSRLTSWIKSTGNGSGNYSDVPANVLAIYHTDQLVYINANSIPSYGIGPWNDNPNIAIAQNLTASVPRVPRPALEKTETGLGAIGLFTNGVAVFNAWDARTYNSVWQTNAFIVEGVSFGKLKKNLILKIRCLQKMDLILKRFMQWSSTTNRLLSQPHQPNMPLRFDRFERSFPDNRLGF